jgi:hypothetical protein
VNSAPALSWTVLGKSVLTLVLGVVVGTIGTIMHRSAQPWGLVLSFLLVLTAAVIGIVWLLGAGVVAIVAMLLPRAWFSDTPLPARPREPALAPDLGGEPDDRR